MSTKKIVLSAIIAEMALVGGLALGLKKAMANAPGPTPPIMNPNPSVYYDQSCYAVLLMTEPLNGPGFFSVDTKANGTTAIVAGQVPVDPTGKVVAATAIYPKAVVQSWVCPMGSHGHFQ